MGFAISSGTIRTIIVVLLLYSAVIVGFSLYVRRASSGENDSQRLKDFLTGGGSLGPVSLAMLTFTAMSTSGSAVGGPGSGYSLGFTWSICVWTGLVYGCVLPFILGKKLVIMRERLHASSLIGLMRHRYGGSKAYGCFLAGVIIIFVGVQVVAQFSGGGRVFSIITGNYQAGILLFGIVTLLYTLAGGIKSVAKIAVIQGFIMVFTVLLLYAGVMHNVTGLYGSPSAAIQWLAQNRPSLVVAETVPVFYNVGLCLIMCWGSIALPGGLVSAMSYKGSSVIIRTGLIAMVCTLIYQFTMSGLGPFVYSMNQGLTSVDYTSVYAATAVLPDVMSGLFVAGIASAVQSTVAALAVLVTGSIVIDLYRNLFAPDAPPEKLNRLNRIVMTAFSLICIILALNPPEMVQTLINFASGGLFSTLLFPIFFGFYSKRANTAGAFAGGICGFLTFLGCSILRSGETTAALYAKYLKGVYPLVPALAVSLLIMVVCMYAGKKEAKGRIQVWFCEAYDEAWADVNR